MQETALTRRLREIIEPLARTQGLVLWGLEAPSGGGRGVLRVYVDAEAGVDIASCAALSRTLSVVLDVEDPLPGSYVLEVSSPGLERPFFSPSQLPPYQGRRIALELEEPLEGRRKWRGRLAEVQGDRLRLETETGEHWFAWPAVKRAHLLFED